MTDEQIGRWLFLSLGVALFGEFNRGAHKLEGAGIRCKTRGRKRPTRPGRN